MNERLHLVLSGRVQGVCFRMYGCDEARRLGVTGWIRNRYDGTVEVLVEGDSAAVRKFRRWCGHGPPHAIVREVQETAEAASGEFGDFQIVY